MVDVLSQNEIDALLAALSSGEMDAEELKKGRNSEKKFEPMISNAQCGFPRITFAA